MASGNSLIEQERGEYDGKTAFHLIDLIVCVENVHKRSCT